MVSRRSGSRKSVLLILGGVAGFLMLVVLVAPFFIDVDRFKPRLETAASAALGMDVLVDGRLRMTLFPIPHVTAEEVRILDARGVVAMSVKRVGASIDLLRLFHRELRLRRVELRQPVLTIERDSEGRLNVAALRKAEALLGTLDGGSVSLSEGTLHYADLRSGQAIEARDLDLNVSRLRFAGGKSPESWKSVSLQAEVACGEIRTKNLVASAFHVTVVGKDGVLILDPVTLRLFGGQMTGSLRADVSDSIPDYRLHCSLPGFRIEEFFKTLSPQKAGEGAMDFSATLSTKGVALGQLVGSAAGQFSLRGRDLTLVGHDLDAELSRFESSQSFNLVDVGAVFLAGPLGLAVTKGYNFASLFQGPGGHSDIATLVSDWRVDSGIAQAKDVALATTRNRIALHGGLDFVHGQFADVTVATIDARGCALVRQAIRGPFGKPVVEKPRALQSLAGPVMKLYRQTRGLFPSGPCEAFYSGSVAAPRP